jgi:hypothetical protein
VPSSSAKLIRPDAWSVFADDNVKTGNSFSNPYLWQHLALLLSSSQLQLPSHSPSKLLRFELNNLLKQLSAMEAQSLRPLRLEPPRHMEPQNENRLN